MVKVYHNTRCSKSRTACSILEENGIETTLIDYLKNPPSINELKDLLIKLNIKAENLVRKNEVLYKEKYKSGSYSETEWLQILSENPILIERPIIVNGKRAVIGRSSEAVLSFIKSKV